MRSSEFDDGGAVLVIGVSTPFLAPLGRAGDNKARPVSKVNLRFTIYAGWLAVGKEF
jgi:hypothetical protein